MSRRAAPWQSTGSAMQALLYPVENDREALRRQGLKPKDHAKENRKLINDMQQRVVAAKTHPKTEEDRFKMARFKDVESQVRQQIIEGVKHDKIPARPATAPTSYVRKGDGMRRRPPTAQSDQDPGMRARTSTKPRVPTRSEWRADEDLVRGSTNVDYVRKNALEAIRASTPSRPKDENTPQKARHEAYGKVPSYLLKRKEELLGKQEAEIHRLTEHPVDCPDGMRLMKEEERSLILQKLDASRMSLLKQLASLPFVTDTPNLQAQKASVEERLAEVEKAIVLYSRQRVFVKM